MTGQLQADLLAPIAFQGPTAASGGSGALEKAGVFLKFGGSWPVTNPPERVRMGKLASHTAGTLLLTGLSVLLY